MAAGGTPNNVTLGPGRLYVAAVGTTEPVSGSAVLPSAWSAIGYTDEGTAFQFETTTEGIPVAEELDPIRYVGVARATRLVVAMAETTARNLVLALGGGAGTAAGAVTINPPNADAQVDVMLVWDSDEAPTAANRRVLFRQCRPSGQVEMANRKAPQKRLIGTTFDCSKPSGALQPFTAWSNASGVV